MAFYKEDILDIELSSGSIARSFLHHTIGSGDQKANRFGVRLFRNGEPVSAESATVTGLFMAPDGTRYVISETSYTGSTGTEGNKAYVQLPPVCYAVTGQFTLAIKLTGGGVEGTMRIIDGTVEETGEDGAVVPTSTIPTTEEIIAAYEEAVAVMGGSVRFDATQSLTSAEKAKARENIGAASETEVQNAINFEEMITSARAENKHFISDLENVTMFKAGCYMDATGAVNEGVPAHSIHVINNAERINQIRFVQINTANAPLFIVKDDAGDVVNTYTPGSSSLNDFQYSCFAVPGGLPIGSKIYINYFYENNDHAKVVTDIDIYFEDVLVEKPHGSDLFSRGKAAELSGCYFGYEDGKQTVLNTYCAGEARISAGDTFVTSKTCHIAYFGEYGVFISGDLNTTGWYKTFTAPEGTVGAIVSFKVAEIEVAECLIDEIHFTVPINQKILKDGEASSTYVDDENDVVEVNAVLKLPQTYTEKGKPTPVIMVFHGAGFYVSSTNWGVYSAGAEGSSTDFDNMMEYFVSCGYAVCDINAYDNTIPNRTFGSQRTIGAYKKLIEYVKANYNVEKIVNGYGFSMGGLVALNYLNAFRNDLKCLALASPVVALFDQGYNGSATWKGAIANSYGFDVPSGFVFSSGTPTQQEMEIWNDNADLSNGYDPFVRSAAEKTNTVYPFMRIWHGDADTAVSYTKSQELSNNIRDMYGECTHRLVENAGHEICYGASGVCNREYIRFFNRFNT